MTNDRTTNSAADLERLSALCQEAVQLHGTDWPQIWAHINAALAALEPPERARLEAAVEVLMPSGPAANGKLTLQ